MNDLEQILNEPLDTDNPHNLKNQLVKCEAWSAGLAYKHREAERELSNMRGKCFNPSLSSEDKRKIQLEYDVREYKAKADLLKDYADILKRRISLGQTMLKSMMEEQKAGL